VTAPLQLYALDGIGEVAAGTDLPALVLAACRTTGIALQSGDVVVVAQKIVSKSEGRMVAIDTVQPSEAAKDIARKAGKDPRIVELILRESQKVMRCVPGVVIVRHRHGTVLANAGIDQSNVPGADGRDYALLWPADPDASAARLRQALQTATGLDLPVVINDSLGRAWRFGTVGAAIGVSGLQAVVDMRGQTDREGRVLVSTEVGQADEIAAAASLLMGQAAEGRPVIIVRGLQAVRGDGRAVDSIRPPDKDLFP
jgi:coenzyme F420-0:L-glutamate ligase/coenzyme F420-1:gamma-L-glutamate ligase